MKKLKTREDPAKVKAMDRGTPCTERAFSIIFPESRVNENSYDSFQLLDGSIMAVHAEDPDRKEKVLKLRHEEVPGLLTTTILERGITIKNVQVAVIGAESTIFNSSALIQIAGRVGRNADFSGGDVVFFIMALRLKWMMRVLKFFYYNKKGFSQ